jgi:MscS family membrane protein
MLREKDDAIKNTIIASQFFSIGFIVWWKGKEFKCLSFLSYMTFGELFALERYLPNDYLRALIIFIVLLVLLRVLLSVFQRIVLKAASKTKTDVDDVLIKKSSTPLTLLAFLFSMRIALSELSFSEDLNLNIARVIYSAIVIVIAHFVYVFADTVLIRGLRKISVRTKAKVDDTITSLIHGTLKIALIVLALLYILDLWGIEVIPILGALGVAGIAVALALQPVLSNIFSGVAMILDKTVRVGDWVVLEDGTWGVIEKIGVRSTKVKSFDNEMIIMPNTKLAESKVQNVSLPEPKARAVVPFGVAYGSDIEKVKKLIVEELKKIENVEEDPAPIVRFLEMGDSSLKFKAYFYVERFDVRFGAIDEANTRIYNALNKAKIGIPFPQMDVHLKKD